MKQRGQIKSPYDSALDILARRSNSEHEIRSKLSQKKFSAEEIDDVIERLRNAHLLNDFEYSQAYIRTALLSKAVGPRWLQNKLRGRGVASEVINSALEDLLDSDKELELVEIAVEKWNRLHPSKRGDTARLNRFLFSRGFTSDAIRSNASTNS